MTDANLDEIEARANAAIAPPWEMWERDGRDCIWLDVIAEHAPDEEIAEGETQPRLHILHKSEWKSAEAEKQQIIKNLEFCAHARQEVPDLVAEVRRLRAALRKALGTRGVEGCPKCSGHGFYKERTGIDYETDSAEEKALNWDRHPCPCRKELGL